MATNGSRLLYSLNGKPTKLLFYAIKGVSPFAIKCHKTKSFPLSAFRFPFFANFAKEKANG